MKKALKIFGDHIFMFLSNDSNDKLIDKAINKI